MDPETQQVLNAMAAQQAADQKQQKEAEAAQGKPTPPATPAPDAGAKAIADAIAPQATGTHAPAPAALDPVAAAAQAALDQVEIDEAKEAAQAATEVVTTRSGQPLPMTKVTIDKLRAEERERGKKLATEELASLAKKAGFGSLEEAFQAIAAGKAAPAAAKEPEPALGPDGELLDAPPATTATKPTDAQVEAAAAAGSTAPDNMTPRQVAIYQRKLEAVELERRKALRKANLATQQKETLEKQVVSDRAAYEHKVTAVKLGIQDPDYAVHLLEKARAGLGSEQALRLKPEAFFKALRTTHPALYGATAAPPVVDKPATTSPAGDPPASGQPAGSGTNGATVTPPAVPNAMKMTREQYEALLNKLGLPDPAAGF